MAVARQNLPSPAQQQQPSQQPTSQQPCLSGQTGDDATPRTHPYAWCACRPSEDIKAFGRWNLGAFGQAYRSDVSVRTALAAAMWDVVNNNLDKSFFHERFFIQLEPAHLDMFKELLFPWLSRCWDDAAKVSCAGRSGAVRGKGARVLVRFRVVLVVEVEMLGCQRAQAWMLCTCL